MPKAKKPATKKSKVKKPKQSRGLPLDDMRWIPVTQIAERLIPLIGDKTRVAQDLTKAVASKKVRCMRRIVKGPADDATQPAIELKQRIPGATLVTRSSDGTLSAEPFFGPLVHRLLETLARLRASHGEEIPSQLLMDSIGGDAGKILSNGNTVGQYIKGLVAEAILPPNVLSHCELVPASFLVECCFAYSNGDIRIAVPPFNNQVPLFLSWARNSVFYLWQPDCVKAWPALASQKVAAREASTSEPLRRKPGPRAKAEWQWFVAMKVCTLKNSAKELPTAGELAGVCRDELGYMPAETAINKLVRELLRLLG